MLPALIVSNVVGLQLAPDTTAAVLGAVLASLLRSGKAAAVKAHIDDHLVTAARTDLGIIASRSNAGVQAVQWSLPGWAPEIGGEWIHEIKHDGYRMMVRRDASGVRLLTRNGKDWTGRFPTIVGAAAGLKTRSCLIDGEAVACDIVHSAYR